MILRPAKPIHPKEVLSEDSTTKMRQESQAQEGMVDLNYTCELPGSRFRFNTGYARILWVLAGCFKQDLL